uniref:Carn_acyltransf domain-containing protein n=1 Tax=Steinernema glaseri TaxID=37863 RepID=A0A1I7Y915_9BILA
MPVYVLRHLLTVIYLAISCKFLYAVGVPLYKHSYETLLEVQQRKTSGSGPTPHLLPSLGNPRARSHPANLLSGLRETDRILYGAENYLLGGAPFHARHSHHHAPSDKQVLSCMNEVSRILFQKAVEGRSRTAGEAEKEIMRSDT